VRDCQFHHRGVYIAVNEENYFIIVSSPVREEKIVSPIVVKTNNTARTIVTFFINIDPAEVEKIWSAPPPKIPPNPPICPSCNSIETIRRTDIKICKI
jgi:hypothetical protein